MVVSVFGFPIISNSKHINRMQINHKIWQIKVKKAVMNQSLKVLEEKNQKIQEALNHPKNKIKKVIRVIQAV